MIGTALSLGQILADPIRYLAILVEGPHEIEFRGNNLSFVAAFEGLQQLLFGVSKPCGSHVEFLGSPGDLLCPWLPHLVPPC